MGGEGVERVWGGHVERERSEGDLRARASAYAYTEESEQASKSMCLYVSHARALSLYIAYLVCLRGGNATKKKICKQIYCSKNMLHTSRACARGIRQRSTSSTRIEPLARKFWKVSVLVHLLDIATIERTVENVCLWHAGIGEKARQRGRICRTPYVHTKPPTFSQVSVAVHLLNTATRTRSFENV